MSPMTQSTPVPAAAEQDNDTSTASSSRRNATKSMTQPVAESEVNYTTQKSKNASSPIRRDLSSMMEHEENFNYGFDSDGEIGPFNDAVKEEEEQKSLKKLLHHRII